MRNSVEAGISKLSDIEELTKRRDRRKRYPKLPPESVQFCKIAAHVYGKPWKQKVCKLVGVHYQTIGRWRIGHGKPSYKHLHILLGEMREHVLKELEVYNNTVNMLIMTAKRLPALFPVQNGAVADPNAFTTELPAKPRHHLSGWPRGPKGHPIKKKDLPTWIAARRRRTSREIEDCVA